MKTIVLSLFFVLSLGIGCTTQPMRVSQNPLNAPVTLNKPYVLLVSLDGFRADYLKWYSPPFLNQMKKTGISASFMKSTYPSKTFTNHWSLVTGLYSENHGIVDNQFYDPIRKQEFKASTPESARDGSWFLGTPLWIAAEKAGMRSAVYFWPGSEAEIHGVRPSYYYHYDKNTSIEDRVSQVQKWLNLPQEERPHFLGVYFSDVDSAGHWYGPHSEKVKSAVLKLDQAVAQLASVIQKSQLPVNLVVVSDHGMQALDSKKVIYLDDLISLDEVKAVGEGTHIHLYVEQDSQLEKVYQKLTKNQITGLRVYLRKDLPTRFHYSKNPRAGDIIVAADDSYSVLRSRRLLMMEGGNHGYDPDSESMRAIFLAQGPQLKSGLELEPFQNIEVYPFILKLLGLPENPATDARGKALDSGLIPLGKK